jgi:putative ABC transport system permease protein
MAASTAIFSLVNGILLRPMPYAQPDRLVFAANASDRGFLGWAPMSYPDLQEWRERQSVVQGLAAYRNVTVTLQEGEFPERLTGMGVTEGIFETLGVQAALGRTFTSDETGPGGPSVALLTWGLWQRRFGGDPGIVGRTINLQGEPHVVVGVMPEGFEFPWWSDIYLPLQEDAARNARDSRNLRAVGRLGDGASVEQARATLEGVQAALRAEYPDSYEGLGVYVNAYQAEERASLRGGLTFLMVGVGLVLLIACVNVANILLARAAGRRREMAIRTSLGAGRNVVIQHLLAESILLGILGGVLGLAVGVVGRDLILALAPIPKPFWMDFSLDMRVLGFVLGASLLTSILFGLAPALFAARGEPAELLRSGGDRNASGRKRWGLYLVAGEVALALALLVSAGSMVKGFGSLLDVDPGFDPEGVLTLGVTLPPANYPGAAEREAFFSEAVDALRTLPGVRAVGAVQSMPLSGDFWGQGFYAEGAPLPEPGQEAVGNLRLVHGDYFGAARIPLLEGRTFTLGEIRQGAPEVVVNATLARRYWPGESAVGKRLKLGGPESESAWRTVIGVVGDVRQNGLDQAEDQPGFYLTYGASPRTTMTLLVRAEGEPTVLTDPVRRVIRRVAPSVPVYSVGTLKDYYDNATGQTRFHTYLLSAFSVIALLLTLLGVAGVMAFVVRGRAREMGIRVALGAPPRAVMANLLAEGMRPVSWGTLAGGGLGFAFLRWLSSSFYEVEAWNPVTYGCVGGLLLLTTMAAVWLPSRHALRLDPARVLQDD